MLQPVYYMNHFANRAAVLRFLDVFFSTECPPGNWLAEVESALKVPVTLTSLGNAEQS